MGRARSRGAAILAFALLSPLSAVAQSATANETAIPTDSNKSFRVAVSAFQGEGLTTDNEYLKQSIPLLLLQRISALGQHHFSNAEFAAYQKSVVVSAIAQQHDKINKLFQQRATILFQSSDPTKELEASTKSISAARARLTFLEKLKPDAVIVAKDKPIEMVQGSNGEPLVSYPLVSPAHTAQELNLDLLVWGSVAQVEDYLVVQIHIFDSAYQREVYSFRKVFSASNVLDSASEVSDHLVSSVLGRDFGSLTLDISPPSALIYLDGDFYGVGSSTIRYMTTGEHNLEIRAPGYRAKKLQVSVSAFSDTKESVELAPVAGTEVVISSIPAGADVYVASEWKGKTPLIISRPAADEALALRLKGYHEYTTTLTPTTPVKLEMHLLPDLFKSQDYVSLLRNRFYTSFGAFALSLAIPISFYSLSQQYLTNAQLTTNPQEFDRLKNLTGVWYYSFLGGAFISSALFTNTIIDIVDYLRAIR